MSHVRTTKDELKRRGAIKEHEGSKSNSRITVPWQISCGVAAA